MPQTIESSRSITFIWSRIAHADGFMLFRWTST